MARQISLKSGQFKIAPSILSADPLDIAGSISSLGGRQDWLHVDIMDGHFVPNLSYGPSLVKALRSRYPDEVLDVHLMVKPVDNFIDMFISSEPDFITVQVEATDHIHRVLSRIREGGCRPGIVLNPGTSVELVRPLLHMVDLVLVMSVNPGFGGQSFIPEVLSKVTSLSRWRAAEKAEFLIEIDGGIGVPNVEDVVRSGVDVAVMGSAVFGSPNPADTISNMLEIARRSVKV